MVEDHFLHLVDELNMPSGAGTCCSPRSPDLDTCSLKTSASTALLDQRSQLEIDPQHALQ
jgi:hypothetical protein